MTATEILIAMLDERGVDHEDYEGTVVRTTSWTAKDGQNVVFMERLDNGKTMFVFDTSAFTPEEAVAAALGPVVTGDTSDGYHTFSELYHHRAVLFSVIVRDHADLAWKSKFHHDGTMYDGMFIVGIDTPSGQATYHYDLDPYWEMFECKELDRAPEWDGHTPDEAIERIATLGRWTCHMRETTLPFVHDSHDDGYFMICSECGFAIYMRKMWMPIKYCSNCGRKVVES